MILLEEPEVQRDGLIYDSVKIRTDRTFVDIRDAGLERDLLRCGIWDKKK